MKERAKRGFITLLVIDMVELLVALWLTFGPQKKFGGPWVWLIFLGMLVITGVYYYLAREEREDEDIIRGLPPEQD